MGFDNVWFDELRNLSNEKISKAKINGVQGYAPLLQELFGYRLVSYHLLNEVDYLLSELEDTDYEFHPLGFRAEERHIYLFQNGRAFRQQWNIGFFAGEDPSEDYARIGLGFSLNLRLSDGKGREEYAYFTKKIRDNLDDFNILMHDIGN